MNITSLIYLKSSRTLFIFISIFIHSFALAEKNSVLVDNRELKNVKAKYNGVTLTLYTGNDPTFDYIEKISFWHLPATLSGQTMVSSNSSGQQGQMSYDKKDPNKNLSVVWIDDEKFKIVFSKEKDYLVMAKIKAESTKPVRIKVDGVFNVQTAGIKIVNGRIDLTYDHLDTIQLLTKNFLKDKYKISQFFDRPDSCFLQGKSKRSKKRRFAYCSFLFLDMNKKLQIGKVLFEKLETGWSVIKKLREDQLVKAVNLIPLKRNAPPYIFSPLAAKRFEKDIYKKLGGYKRIPEPSIFVCGGGQKNASRGYCKVNYYLYPSERKNDGSEVGVCHLATYLFDKNKAGTWEITKVLASDKKYDYRKNKVIDNDISRSSCF